MKEKKVAIVGFGGTRADAPYYDENYEIWGLNDLYDVIPRWTRWFDIHDFDSKDPNSIKTHKSERAKHQKLVAYKKMNCPIYCQEEWPEIPNAVKFPLKEIQDSLCDGEKGYFTNQVPYMIAFAIYEGFTTIDLYGVEMGPEMKYPEHKPSIEYWIGVARGKGIKVYIPDQSFLLKTPFLYGFEGTQMGWEMTKE